MLIDPPIGDLSASGKPNFWEAVGVPQEPRKLTGTRRASRYSQAQAHTHHLWVYPSLRIKLVERSDENVPEV